jgi:hypothetical protein
MKLRDYQRQKCYDSEGDTAYRKREFDKFPQVYRFAYKVLLDPYVSKSIPFMPGVQPGYGMQRGVYPWHANNCCVQLNPNWAWASKYMINLPPWSWSRLVVLHEISHVISLHNYGPHGRIHSQYWATTFLNMLDRYLSTRAANQLQDAFDKRGVDYV